MDLVSIIIYSFMDCFKSTLSFDFVRSTTPNQRLGNLQHISNIPCAQIVPSKAAPSLQVSVSKECAKRFDDCSGA